MMKIKKINHCYNGWHCDANCNGECNNIKSFCDELPNDGGIYWFDCNGKLTLMGHVYDIE